MSLELKVEFVPEVITACLSLCNLRIRNVNLLEPEEGGDGDDDCDDGCDQANEPLQQSGKTFKSRLSAAMSAPDVRIHVLQEFDYY